MEKKKIIIGISGASGSIYGRLLLERLSAVREQYAELALIFTDNGKKVWQFETGSAAAAPEGFREFSNDDLFAPPASGSAAYDGMIICPCSMAMMARIAQGIATDLITRAADVMLKERRQLILAIREMPYSLIHIRNMETVTLAGGIICPASPSFYSKPESLEDAANTVVEKILSLSGMRQGNFEWGK
jgi:4-hydroxy-3-polyprenylbenzoate decarboxylase